MFGYYGYGFNAGLAYCDRVQQSIAQNIERSFMYAGISNEKRETETSEEEKDDSHDNTR